MTKQRLSRSIFLIACFVACLLSVLPVGASGPAPSHLASREARVTEAMLRTYFHGVDDELARRVLSPGDVSILRKLLSDPDFPRRDNVVAFLAHLDRGE